jgi:hypothetical protein
VLPLNTLFKLINMEDMEYEDTDKEIMTPSPNLVGRQLNDAGSSVASSTEYVGNGGDEEREAAGVGDPGESPVAGYFGVEGDRGDGDEMSMVSDAENFIEDEEGVGITVAGSPNPIPTRKLPVPNHDDESDGGNKATGRGRRQTRTDMVQANHRLIDTDTPRGGHHVVRREYLMRHAHRLVQPGELFGEELVMKLGERRYTATVRSAVGQG